MSSDRTCQLTDPANTTLLDIAVAVVLGNPKYEDCEQHGICRVERLHEFLPCACGHRAPALLRMSKFGPESMIFNKLSVGRDTYEKHFSGGGFRVESHFVFSETFLESLRLSGKQYRIAPGVYPILEHGGLIEILFGIKG